MTKKLRKLLGNKLTSNTLSLYAVQACTYLLPLVTYPYLSRVLGPAGWGAILFAQAIGVLIVVGVEYGFDLSATRETARFAQDRERLSELVAGVLGAKVLLAAVSVGLAVLSRPLTLRVAPSPVLFWASCLWGVGQGINMLWYFQGLQRMGRAASLDITGKVVATLSIFVLVRHPEDGWKVMAAQAIGCTVAHAITVVTAYREVGFRWPTFRRVKEALLLGWPMFLFKASQTLLTSANGLILGFFASPAALGYFAGADRMRQVANQGLMPLNQALFPHQSRVAAANLAAGLTTVRRSLLAIGGLSTVGSLIVYIAAPMIVRIVLGPAFTPTVPILRVFTILIPLTAIATVVCFQWLLPLGFDHQFNRIVLMCGVINIVVGILLAPKLGGLGMAVALTVSECAALIGFDLLLRAKGISPFGRSLPKQPEDTTEALEPEGAAEAWD